MPASISASELTEAHFEHSPVWQFRLDAEGEEGVDESHVLPAPDGLRLGSHGSFVVHAAIRLVDGRQLPGAVQVNILAHRVFFTPVFLYAGGKQLDPLSADVDLRIARITQQPRSRPVGWVLHGLFAGENSPRSGRIARSNKLRILGLLWQLLQLRLIPRGSRGR